MTLIINDGIINFVEVLSGVGSFYMLLIVSDY